MIAARQHLPPLRKPRGVWLAFLAAVMQVLVPFFLMVEIARANEPGSAAVICSSLGHATHQDSGDATDHGLAAHCCSICTALAAAQGFAAPTAPASPLPGSAGRTILAIPDIPLGAGFLTYAYRSRGPPAIA